MLRLLLVVLMLGCGAANASDRTVVTPDGDEIPVTVSAAGGDRLLLWINGEFGSTTRRTTLAKSLAEQGVEVWAADLHAAWFLPIGRYSLNDVDPAAVAALLDAAVASGKKVYLMTEGRVAALALGAVRTWQLAGRATPDLRGLFAFSPRLFVSTPQGGESAEYLAVAGASNLPTYLLQPEDSAGFWHAAQDVRELEKGGAPVFLHRLAGVSDGFHVRPDFSPEEARMTARLPTLLQAAMSQLDEYGGTPRAAAAVDAAIDAPQKPEGSDLLRPYPGERQAPALQLPALDGGSLDLAMLRGKVVLVNFWATWCPPCVEEIPSLQRLYRRLQPHGLEILAVDVGETVATMREFLADKPVEFPVLMDSDGEALRRWGIYAFPTTLVLDRHHRIRYAVFGAFDWSSQEVIDTLEPLLAAPPG